MTIRRALADAIDPTRAAETIALHDRIKDLRVELAATKAVHAVARSIQRETIEWLSDELATARADVAAQLEQAYECAHDHERTTDE